MIVRLGSRDYQLVIWSTYKQTNWIPIRFLFAFLFSYIQTIKLCKRRLQFVVLFNCRLRTIDRWKQFYIYTWCLLTIGVNIFKEIAEEITIPSQTHTQQTFTLSTIFQDKQTTACYFFVCTSCYWIKQHWYFSSFFFKKKENPHHLLNQKKSVYNWTKFDYIFGCFHFIIIPWFYSLFRDKIVPGNGIFLLRITQY